MRPGAVRGLAPDRRGRRSPCASRRSQHLLAHESLPRLAGDLLDQLAGDDVEHVVVGVGAAEARRRLEVAEPPHGLGAGRGSSAAQTSGRRRRGRGRCGARAGRRTVISRVTHGSYIWNQGMCFVTGSSQSIWPRSTSTASAAVVKAFPTEPSWKIVSASTGASSPGAAPRSRAPGSPCRAGRSRRRSPARRPPSGPARRARRSPPAPRPGPRRPARPRPASVTAPNIMLGAPESRRDHGHADGPGPHRARADRAVR